MKITTKTLRLVVAALAVLALGGVMAAQGPAPRNPKNLAEFDLMFHQISNWGRWGPDDQLGSVNLITDAKRKQALSAVKVGTSVSLAHNPLTDKAEDNNSPFEFTMNGGGRGGGRPGAPPNPFGISTDTYKVSYHGYAHSHIDALCHLGYLDKAYNGYPRAEVVTEKGCTKLGIENIKNGIITRGILIDIPRLKNVPYLEPGTPVFVEDIEAWERKAGVKVSSGDAVFLRTGRWARRAALGAWNVGQNEAGFHASVAPWMKARGVAIVGSDVAQDVVPSLVEGVALPVHNLLIVGLGINLLDNLDLEAVGDTAAKLNRWEFSVTIAPIPVTGATGSPISPIAQF